MLRNGLLLAFGCACLIASNSLAQPQIDLWREYDHGALSNEFFQDIYRYSQGGYLLCGVSFPSGWVTRLDEEGEIVWQVLTDTSLYASVIETDNGDALVGGSKLPAYTGFRACRIGSEGNLIWLRDYAVGHCSAVIELKAGNFMLAGWTGRLGYITCVQPDGEPIWGNTYRIVAENEFHKLYGMRETDGGVVLAGSYAPQGGATNGWIIKVGFDGEVVWSRRYEGGTGREFSSIVSHPAGGFALGGKYRQDWAWGSNESKFCFTLIDADGNIRDNRVYNLVEGRGDILYGLNKFADGYILVGFTSSLGYTYPLALRLNRSFDPVWSLHYPEIVEQRPAGHQPNTPTYLKSVVVDEHGVITACGSFMSESNERGQDGLIVRLEPTILGPQVFYYSPEDTVFTTLLGSEIDFIVRARTREGNELHHRWFYNETELGADTLQQVEFDSLGENSVVCQLSDADGEIHIGWNVTVDDLFIVFSSPDTLALALRRGVSQTFSLDSVAAVAGDPIQYQWTLTDLDNFQSEDAGTEPRATIDFLRSGNYQLEGLAYRGEASDNVVWNIQVRSAILDFAPRDLSLSVLADSLVSFEVIPFNPESDSLSYRWEVDGDSAGGEATFERRFASSPDLNRRYLVTAIVMDDAEGDTVAWTVSVRDPDGVSNSEYTIVEKFGFLSASPNPFNSTTTITFSIPSTTSSSSLTLHDLTGRQVLTLVDSPLSPGQHSITLNAADLPAGIYLLNLQSAHYHSVAKIALIR